MVRVVGGVGLQIDFSSFFVIFRCVHTAYGWWALFAPTRFSSFGVFPLFSPVFPCFSCWNFNNNICMKLFMSWRPKGTVVLRLPAVDNVDDNHVTSRIRCFWPLSICFAAHHILFWPCLGCLTGNSRLPFVCRLIFITFMLLPNPALHTCQQKSFTLHCFYSILLIFSRSLAASIFSSFVWGRLFHFCSTSALIRQKFSMQSINLNKLKSATGKKNKYEIASLWVLNAGFKELRAVAHCTKANKNIYRKWLRPKKKGWLRIFIDWTGPSSQFPFIYAWASLVLSLSLIKIFAKQSFPFTPT